MPEVSSTDPFATATLIEDPQYSEIVPENGAGATPAGGATPAAPGTKTKVDDGFAPVKELGAQPGADGDGAATPPDFMTELASLTPEPPAGRAGDDGELVLDEITPEDEAFIQSAANEAEFRARTQQVKKRIHDVNSARIGRYKAEMRVRERFGASAESPSSAAVKQPSGDVPAQPPPQSRPFVPDPTKLPEYAAMIQAKAARDAAVEDPTAYVKADEAYEAARDRFTDAKVEMRLAAERQDRQRASDVERAYAADRRLDQEWTGDLIRPIPWADMDNGQGGKIPGVKSLFQALVQRDPTLPDRNPHRDPVERAKWMATQVSEAFPRHHALHLDRVRAQSQKRTKDKTAASPTVSGQTDPLKGQQQNRGDVTSGYLAYINQGRR